MKTMLSLYPDMGVHRFCDAEDKGVSHCPLITQQVVFSLAGMRLYNKNQDLLKDGWEEVYKLYKINQYKVHLEGVEIEGQQKKMFTTTAFLDPYTYTATPYDDKYSGTVETKLTFTGPKGEIDYSGHSQDTLEDMTCKIQNGTQVCNQSSVERAVLCQKDMGDNIHPGIYTLIEPFAVIHENTGILSTFGCLLYKIPKIGSADTPL
ncbi:MAG: hypothetical protein ACR2PT_09035 [Endozoicomonas sp.]